MEPAKRIIINTTAQYARAIINTCLSLYSVRLILDALGVADYGIYSVIGGVVALLGFITNALVITTQRYISFHHGRGEVEYVKQLFKNSLLLHMIIAVGIIAILLLLKNWLVFGFLNIPPLRLHTAGNVYFVSTLILGITIITAPFKALFIARENIVYISVVEVIDGFIKLTVAIALAFIPFDKLLVYACMIAAIQAANLLAFAAYALWRFPECSIRVSGKDISRESLAQLASFAGWTTYGAGAIACRTQGAAVILNHFFGTVINAAYGIANQLYGAIVFVSSSVLNAMNPQIMKAEGAHKREQMLTLAGQQSKFSAALMMIVAIPLMYELPVILSLWLKEVPPSTVMFSRFIFIAFICDQLTIGLNAANQAVGQIRTYTLLMFTPKLLYLPIAWYILKSGGSPEHIMWLYLTIEVIVAAMRIPYLHRTAGLNMSHYMMNVIVPLIPLCTVMVTVSSLCTWGSDFPFRFIMTFTLSVISGLACAWYFTLSEYEREFIISTIKKKRKS